MHAHASLPCHHPKWPRRCPHCNAPADGFNVTVPLRKKWNPETRRMEWWAWCTSGMACLNCLAVIIPNAFSEGISEDYVRALIQCDLSLSKIQVVPKDQFERECCLPAEAPKGASHDVA